MVQEIQCLCMHNKGEIYDNNNNYTHHCDKEHDIILFLHNRRHEIATPIATLLLNYANDQ